MHALGLAARLSLILMMTTGVILIGLLLSALASELLDARSQGFTPCDSMDMASGGCIPGIPVLRSAHRWPTGVTGGSGICSVASKSERIENLRRKRHNVDSLPALTRANSCGPVSTTETQARG